MRRATAAHAQEVATVDLATTDRALVDRAQSASTRFTASSRTLTPCTTSSGLEYSLGE